MKYFLILLVCACVIGQLSGAAVNSSVEEHTDTVVDGTLVTDEDCHQPREIGRCFALFHRYAFNVESRKCEEFIYGGCAGNSNNFDSMEECVRKCMKSLDDVPATSTQEPRAEEIAPEKVHIAAVLKSTESSD